MKVLNIGSNVDLANQIQDFTKKNCAPNEIRFLEDGDGNLFVSQEVLNDPAFQKYTSEILDIINAGATVADYVAVEYVTESDKIPTQRLVPSKFDSEIIDGAVVLKIKK